MKQTSAGGLRGGDVQPRWAPQSPGVAIVIGVLLVFFGAWALADVGPPLVAGACIAIGAAFLITGAVAKGVAWGIDLHLDSRP